MPLLARWLGGALSVAAILSVSAPALAATPYDRSKYMAPEDLKPGMKGYGRTVMSGAKIETFDVEVIDVVYNAYYPKQAVILVRCAGLNLEHSGIVGGMSGSPCYMRGEDGQERMIGAVAYGWTFTKDPICGLQPITQMLEIPDARDPAKRPKSETGAATTLPAGAGEAVTAARGAGHGLGEMIARSWKTPIGKGSRFSIFNSDIAAAQPVRPAEQPFAAQLRPMRTPVMVGGVSEAAMEHIGPLLRNMGLEPVASGSASSSTQEALGEVKLEPGSSLAIPMVSGDMAMEALGTCTEIIGDRVLGFGHPMEGKGWTELPMGPGLIHTVIPSVMRSNKMGAALKPVGTLWGDESTGIFGTIGAVPRMVPLDVVVHDLHGTTNYHYEVAHDRDITPVLLSTAVIESVYARSTPPADHTVRYSMETVFEGLGTFRTSNLTSQESIYSLSMSMLLPPTALMNSPYGAVKVRSAKAEVFLESGARSATVDRVALGRQLYKPGETVHPLVRWAHYRSDPPYTEQGFDFKLPDDLADGEYALTVCSSDVHMAALRSEKPHLFKAESSAEALRRFNELAAVPDNRLYLRLGLPDKGLAVHRVELPNLPSFQARIYGEFKRTDINPYKESLVSYHEMPFDVDGGQTLQITVSRRADQ